MRDGTTEDIKISIQIGGENNSTKIDEDGAGELERKSF